MILANFIYMVNLINNAMKIFSKVSVWFVADLQPYRTLYIITAFQILFGLELDDTLRLLSAGM